MAKRSRAAREPDVEIAARVRARELRFESKPNVRVVVYSDAPAEGGTEGERDGLPDELQPGVTYHDIDVRWRVGARLIDTEEQAPENR